MMKKLIAGYDGGNIRYVISEDGEPYAAGVYTSNEAMAGDVVLAVCRENSRSSGGFFADAGLGRTDFIAKTPRQIPRIGRDGSERQKRAASFKGFFFLRVLRFRQF